MPDPAAIGLYGIEAGQIVQGHGDRIAAFQMVLVQRLEGDLVADIGICHQHRLRLEIGQGLTQAAARAQNFIFILQPHRRPGCKRCFHLPAQMMGIDDDWVTADCHQALKLLMQKRPVQHRKKRLGAQVGIGFEPGAETCGKENGLHEKWNKIDGYGERIPFKDQR